jgi:hypothetical protein
MIDIDKKITKKITASSRSNLTPKSIRCSNIEMNELALLKDKILDITKANKCSDAKAFNLAVTISNLSSDTLIKKALSGKL